MNELVGLAKQMTLVSKAGFLRRLEHVPDDKLTWAPSATSYSALRIAAHIGISNFGMAAALRGETPPFNSLDDLLAAQESRETAIATRADAVKMIDDGAADFVATLDGLTAERIAGSIVMPFGTFPVAAFMFLAASHMDGHAGQIDYLQTIWGDRKNYL